MMRNPPLGESRSSNKWRAAASTLLLTASTALAQNTGLVEFEAGSYTVNEQAGLRTVAIKRTGGSEGSLTVGYATADGTATVADSDYVAASGTLVFAEGETRKAITVQIANAGVDTANETLSLSLSDPLSQGILGTNTTTTLSINDTPTINNLNGSNIPLAAQATAVSTAMSPLAFTVGDAETAAGSLVLSAASSNPGLVPVGNIFFGGSGANRTVTVTPLSGISGATKIYIIATDEAGGP